MRVLEQRRAAYGDRAAGSLEEREEVSNELVGQLCTQEVLQNCLVGGIAECYLVQVVGVHKLVEDVGTEHHRLGDADLYIFELTELRVGLYYVVEECQTSTLPSQRAVTDTGKVAVGIELTAVEDCHDANVLHAAVLHYGVEDNLAVHINILQLMPRDGLEELRHGEDSAGTKPTAHVVARDMVKHGVVGNGEDIILQLLEVTYAHYLFLGLRVAEHEVAKAHVVSEEVTQVYIHLLGVLVDERYSLRLGTFAVVCLGTLHYKRHVLVVLADGMKEFEACLGVNLSVYREATVADDADGVVGILIIKVHSLFVVSCEHNLRTTAHAKRCAVRVKSLGSEALTLGKNVVIQVGQHRGIETYAVLNEKYHLDARLLDVVFQIHAVLDEFYYREDEVGVAEPAEDVVED